MGLLKEQCAEWKEGTSAVLLQSGLDNEWWAGSMECHCYLRNIKIFCLERRFGKPCNGPVIPFRAMVEYHPISAKDLSRLHQFGPKVLPGIFFDHVLHARRNLERRHSGRRHWRIGRDGLHARRFNAKEVLTPMKGDSLIFPVADGTL